MGLFGAKTESPLGKTHSQLLDEMIEEYIETRPRQTVIYVDPEKFLPYQVVEAMNAKGYLAISIAAKGSAGYGSDYSILFTKEVVAP